jgi:hypothetical protein
MLDGKQDLLGDATYDWAGNDLQGRGLYRDERLKLIGPPAKGAEVIPALKRSTTSR